MSAISNSSPGIDARVEMTKKTASSTRPPKYPALTPNSSAIGMTMRVVSPPTSSATRAPLSVWCRTSRPRMSVPSRCRPGCAQRRPAVQLHRRQRLRVAALLEVAREKAIDHRARLGQRHALLPAHPRHRIEQCDQHVHADHDQPRRAAAPQVARGRAPERAARRRPRRSEPGGREGGGHQVRDDVRLHRATPAALAGRPGHSSGRSGSAPG